MAQRVHEPPRSVRMSYEEYLAWYDEGRRGEWVDGEVIECIPPTVAHQTILGFLCRVVAGYVERFDLGLVLPGPCELWLALVPAARTPDVMFVARPHINRVKENRVEGAADLVVELISKESVTRDRKTKFKEYEAAEIPEYWLFESRPGRQYAAFFHLGANASYESIPLDPEGRYHSRVLPGFWLKPAWLWQQPLPKVDELMRLWPVPVPGDQ